MCRFEFGNALLDARLRFCRVLLALACGRGRGRGRVLACGGLVVGLGLDKPCFAACDGDEVQDALLVGRFRVFAGVGQFGFEFGDTCVSRGQRIGIGVASVAIIAPSVAIILGVIYSAILYVARSSRIHVAFSTIDGNRLRYDVGKSPILDSAGVVYVTGSLFFGAVDEFNHRLQDIPEEDHLILSLRGMPSVDVSGAQAVLELCQRLLAKGHTIAFCGVAEDVRSYFDRAGVTALVGESAYYHSADRAILALLDEELLEA